MRRILVILMLVLLPFQFVWGAATSYCQHEQGAGVGHFGHHVHKHQGKVLKVGEPTPDTKTITSYGDLDCASCHLTSVSPVVMHTAVRFSSELSAAPSAALSSQQPLYIPHSIERPKWTLAA